jgi:hypothetical protein
MWNIYLTQIQQYYEKQVMLRERVTHNVGGKGRKLRR